MAGLINLSVLVILVNLSFGLRCVLKEPSTRKTIVLCSPRQNVCGSIHVTANGLNGHIYGCENITTVGDCQTIVCDHLKTLAPGGTITNCTASCCQTDLCNDYPTTVGPTSTTHSTPGSTPTNQPTGKTTITSLGKQISPNVMLSMIVSLASLVHVLK